MPDRYASAGPGRSVRDLDPGYAEPRDETDVNVKDSKPPIRAQSASKAERNRQNQHPSHGCPSASSSHGCPPGASSASSAGQQTPMPPMFGPFDPQGRQQITESPMFGYQSVATPFHAHVSVNDIRQCDIHVSVIDSPAPSTDQSNLYVTPVS
jgi:hypothetical protein